MRKLLLITIVSWLAGAAAYLVALLVIYGQRISSGDLGAVLFWSLLACLLVLPSIYAPSMFALRHVLHGCKPAFWFPLVASLLGILPVTLIVWSQGGGAGGLLSSEAVLFHCMFIVLGIVFGLGFVRQFGAADTHTGVSAGGKPFTQ